MNPHRLFKEPPSVAASGFAGQPTSSNNRYSRGCGIEIA